MESRLIQINPLRFLSQRVTFYFRETNNMSAICILFVNCRIIKQQKQPLRVYLKNKKNLDSKIKLVCFLASTRNNVLFICRNFLNYTFRLEAKFVQIQMQLESGHWIWRYFHTNPTSLHQSKSGFIATVQVRVKISKINH